MNSISVGEGTIFGENVRLYDHNHIYLNSDIPIKQQGYTSAPINIGKHCWIGSNVTILKGVTIGDNCVIGAGCVIHEDVPANSIVVNKQELIIKGL
jgi:acetyltransferase-like isoleucine patch superfamily enzyme